MSPEGAERLSLDRGTHLTAGYLTVYPGAGEAAWVAGQAGSETRRDPCRGCPLVTTTAELEARKLANRQRSARRARSTIRRLSTQYRLTFFWSLTYADPQPETRDQVVHHAQTFFKRLRRRFEGFHYIWVIERGSKNGRWHVHFLTDSWLEHAELVEAWGHGFAWIPEECAKKANRTRANASRLARYLSKYVGKDLDEDLDGANSYGRSHGMKLEVRRRLLNCSEALWVATTMLKAGADAFLSFSDEWIDYDGPPCWVLAVP